ncbi:MAG: tRNA (guanosine(46)-N7)-methyltransferase TrmB [Actinomycetota bacterium]
MTIKSFKLRGTRITEAQLAARQRLWGRYGVELANTQMDFARLFPENFKIICEIGFGMGETTIEIAEKFPENGYLAIDVHQPGIGKLLALIEEKDLSNLKVMDADAHLVLMEMVPNGSLDAIHLFFPDPWPKTRHHKRRIVNSSFIDLAAKKLKSGGVFHIATDWSPYATWIEDHFVKSDAFVGGAIERPIWRPLTRFESQGLKKDHVITDFSYTNK